MVSVWMNSLKLGPFTTRTVHELLWGYEDALLARIAPTNPDVEKIFGLMYKARTASNVDEERFVKQGKKRKTF